MTIDEILELAVSVKGFMPRDEGVALFEVGRDLVTGPTWLELGAWCGKSTLYLGAAAQSRGAVLYSLDHHHGSEENQRGWEYFDETLVDPFDGRLNTLPTWQRSIARAGLEDTVIGLVGASQVIAPHFAQSLDFLFLDGGHGHDVAWRDYHDWVPKVVVGGVVAIHDVFENPADGGRPPYEVYLDALRRGFVEIRAAGSLRVLRRQ